MTEIPYLENCPFCGKPPKYIEPNGVYCNNRKCWFYANFPAPTVEQWNQRFTERQLRSDIEMLKQTLDFYRQKVHRMKAIEMSRWD